MKKFLLTTTMLVGFVAVAQAQQGRVGINTTTPAATLDVVANTTDPARPDAVLVPRMTAAELTAKNGAYLAAQNGALVFVTSGTGTAGTKTANVTGTGFYYYDNATSRWVTVGGGAATQRFEEIRGNVVTTSAATYNVQSTDFFIITSGTGTAITLPVLTPVDAGRVLYFFNNNNTVTANTITNTNITLGLTVMNQLRGYVMVWSGTSWVAVTK